MSTTRAARRSRYRTHLIYYALAAFDVFGVSLGLYLSHRVSGVYAESSEADRWWAERLSGYWDLERLAREVKAPTSDVFFSEDVPGEVRKMHAALARFNGRIESERAELTANVPAEEKRFLGQELDGLHADVLEMTAEASWLFARFEPDRPQLVTPHLGTLEQKYAALDASLVRLRGHATGIQHRHMEGQTAIAASLQRLDYLFASLILVMVTAATVYGRKLAGQAQLAERDLEDRVRERTEELDQTNRTLRQEIERREQTDEALSASEDRYRTLFDSNPQPTWVYDVDTLQVLAVNHAAVEHYGYSREEFLAMSLAEIWQGDSAGAPADQAAPNGAGIEGGLGRHRKKDGAVIDVEICSHAVPFGGRPARLILAADVTRRMRLEDQLRQSQKMEAVGRLAGGVAHDFNNLLNVITGYGELLRNRLPAGDRLLRNADEILKAAGRAAGLTRQLLAFSRKQVIQPKVLDLNLIVVEMHGMLRRLIGEDIRLTMAAASDLGRVKADAGQIEQVVMNLVVNARDAMPEGGTLTLETRNVVLDEAFAAVHLGARPGRYVMLAVSDTGIGMDADTRRRIFEPFFTTKGPTKGTGLGLATVHGIVQQSGGHIWVYSEPGQGTTFKIYLPEVLEAGEEPKESPQDATPLSGSETILLVEDEGPLRAVICEILGACGYKVLEAESPDQALSLASSHGGSIDLMLSDVVMPQMTGPQTAQRLQAFRPDARVLYMSGYTDEHIGRHGVLDPATSFIQKPFTVRALLSKVREVLELPSALLAS
jgi:hypothetical protein